MDKKLLDLIEGEVFSEEPMSRHTTFQIGGKADFLVIPKNMEDVRIAISFANTNSLPFCIIGNGSKILVSDKGIRGLVLKVANTLNNISLSENSLHVGAGCQLSKLIQFTTSKALSGLEFAVGIPGTVGGAIVMNAGTFLGSFQDIVKKVDTINIDSSSLRSFSNEECQFGYRTSFFQMSRYFITGAEIRIRNDRKTQILERIRKVIARRKNQPMFEPNAGCIFTNPSGSSAGSLIDAAGLKGYRIGGAMISEAHANFILNVGNAKADDVYKLIRITRMRVKRQYGIELELELQLVGEW